MNVEQEPAGTDSQAGGRTGRSLVVAATNRMGEALGAWLEEDFDRAAASAPIAVELLAKAVLWGVNPTLLVPLDVKNEKVLVDLAVEPNLDSPALRTIGLRVALGRLTKLLGDLPVPAKRQERLVACRDGSLHVGTLPHSGAESAETTARQVLADSLTICIHLLEQLGTGAGDFFGDKNALVLGLLEARRSEVEHRVSRRMAQAAERLEQWREHFSNDELWEESASTLENAVREAYLPQDFGLELGAIAQVCPSCGWGGLLLGRVDVDSDVDVDYSDGQTVYHGYWILHFYPRAFACNVCKLILSDAEQLEAAHVSSSEREVREFELGDDFSASEWAESLYGLRD